MGSRDSILGRVKANQPEQRELPEDHAGPEGVSGDLTPRFISVVEAIGGAVFLVSGFDRIVTILREQFPEVRKVVSGCSQLGSFAAATTLAAGLGDPHGLADVDLAILPAHFGVAENGACWLTEGRMVERVLPLITQNLVLVVRRDAIVATMHQAYARIAEIEAGGSYGFAAFIAGPSKTADIEQSLVLGAHGPKSLTVFLLDEHLSDAGFF